MERILFASCLCIYSLAAIAGDQAVSVAKHSGQDEPFEQKELTLSDDEIYSMQMQVIEDYPELASSPGLKIATAHTAYVAHHTAETKTIRMGQQAMLFFHPYAESHGVKLAKVATCTRIENTDPWNCTKVRQRNYVQLAGQAFEVRVSGVKSAATVLALRTASQTAVEQHPARDRAALLTVSVYTRESLMLTWGTAEGLTRLAVEATLREGEDPTLPESWNTKELIPET